MPSTSTRHRILFFACTLFVVFSGLGQGTGNTSITPTAAFTPAAALRSSTGASARSGSALGGVRSSGPVSSSIQGSALNANALNGSNGSTGTTGAAGTAAPAATARTTSSTAGGLRFGLTYPEILTGMSDATLGSYLDDAVSLGVGWIRFDLPWDMVQSGSANSYDWSAVDRVVSAANARNLSLVPIVQYTPAWARPSSCTGSDHCAPASASQYAAFAAAAAGRYAPLGVHTWELWNEPNTGGAWMPSANVGQYTALVHAASSVIKGVDATAVVLSGGLAPAAT